MFRPNLFGAYDSAVNRQVLGLTDDRHDLPTEIGAIEEYRKDVRECASL